VHVPPRLHHAGWLLRRVHVRHHPLIQLRLPARLRRRGDLSLCHRYAAVEERAAFPRLRLSRGAMGPLRAAFRPSSHQWRWGACIA